MSEIISIEDRRHDLEAVEEAIRATATVAGVELSEAEREQLRRVVRLDDHGRLVETCGQIDLIRGHAAKHWRSWDAVDEVIETMLAGPLGSDAA